MRDQPNSVPPKARGGDVHQLDPPLPVMVWLCIPRVGWQRLEGVATTWTARAACVEYTDDDG